MKKNKSLFEEDYKDMEKRRKNSNHDKIWFKDPNSQEIKWNQGLTTNHAVIRQANSRIKSNLRKNAFIPHLKIPYNIEFTSNQVGQSLIQSEV